jgi:4-hydroxy-tetrahydrodipicolinate reductase
MGALVETRARREGLDVGEIVTSADAARDPEDLAARLRGHDAAIDFSVGPAVLRNVLACLQAGVPLVEGTTGWRDREADVRRAVERERGTLVIGENFSVGVNLFYRIVARAAELFAGSGMYDPYVEEAHHANKRDAPSGTALRLRNAVRDAFGTDVPVASTRAGHIPGTHRVGFDGEADQVTLIHTARNREGFVSGALLAAGWIQGKRGVFGFAEVLEEMVGGGK